jgi:hypothetical protein
LLTQKSGQSPEYRRRLDYIELALRSSKYCEVTLVGQNLLDNHYREWATEGFAYTANEVRRTVYANATWRY